MQEETRDAGLTRALLSCGIITGLVFFAVALTQSFTRAGFDIRRNALSQLSLGELGWIQIANFLLTGLLAIACAIGVRLALKGQKGGTWGPLLVGIFGVGLIVAGIFPPDPAFSYPPGTPAGPPVTMSGHSALHGLGFFLSLVSVIAGCFVFVRRFSDQRERGWVIYCVATAVAAPVLIALSNLIMSWIGVIVALAGAVLFGWVAAIAARLRSEISRGQG